MSAFGDMLAADAAAVCSGEFSEPITYTPVSDVGIVINAIVERNPPEKTGATPRQLNAGLRVYIQKPLLPARPILGGDKVQIGDDDKTYAVVAIMDESDPGVWTLVIN